jgi:hypothetical protein
VPGVSHRQYVRDSDFTCMASCRGRLVTWVGARVADWNGSDVWQQPDGAGAIPREKPSGSAAGATVALSGLRMVTGPA